MTNGEGEAERDDDELEPAYRAPFLPFVDPFVLPSLVGTPVNDWPSSVSVDIRLVLSLPASLPVPESESITEFARECGRTCGGRESGNTERKSPGCEGDLAR